ncbi:ABC transporter substrate-binding protein [Rhizosaccharibacter radicis]|uniref:ABC transporter substrate-binding protein n=1 Tax=Rhizosaccharibacter radicis TaxID=2782605 RepID=A0ABT1VTV3_9PROT|nr:ABC transporter substrate-binding protein [Acetobacteraceae bacterium KSS12]
MRISSRVAGAALVLLAASSLAGVADAKPIESIGVTMGSLGNPYFVALTKGVTDAARAKNPSIKVTAVSADYDLNKQFTQIDNFIAAGVNLIVLNAVDPNAILPAIKRAQKAGIAVVAADVSAEGADATVETDNTMAGRLSCQFLAEKLGAKGNVVIENGPQVSAVTDRVKGCKEALAKAPGIKILDSTQDGKGSRDGGLQVMQGYLIRYPDLNGVFTINDPQAIGSDLAAKQQHRSGIVITSVDGAPDIVAALKTGGMIQASASQDPYRMGQNAVKVGQEILDGQKPAQPVMLMTPKLITQANVGSYVGWTDH